MRRRRVQPSPRCADQSVLASACAGDPRPCILITGFGPFPGAPFNPTGDLVRALCKVRRPALASVRHVPHIFRTSYAVVDAEFPALLATHRPCAVLMFGLAARTPFVRIETIARNVRSVLLADAAGGVPAGGQIDRNAPVRARGRAPFVRMLAAASAARVPVRTSFNAGRYLCNYLYWRAVARKGTDAPKIVVFVHVPSLRPRPGRRPPRRKLTAADLARMGEALLCVVAAEMRR